jgi:alkaline phosphatase D
MDKWDGYVAARQRLYARLLETKAPNPVVLSGDVHMHYGADLKVDFTSHRSPTIGVEFTNSSITSVGDGSDVAPGWAEIKGDNPHIKYHSARRGYIACTATPATMRADFKILDKVTVPDLPARIGGSMVVEAGRAGSHTD